MSAHSRPRRQAFSDEEHAQGLRDTEALLVARLKELGYQPTLEPIDYLGSRVNRRRSGGEQREDAQPKPDGDAPWHNVYVDIPGTGSTRGG